MRDVGNHLVNVSVAVEDNDPVAELVELGVLDAVEVAVAVRVLEALEVGELVLQHSEERVQKAMHDGKIIIHTSNGLKQMKSRMWASPCESTLLR